MVNAKAVVLARFSRRCAYELVVVVVWLLFMGIVQPHYVRTRAETRAGLIMDSAPLGDTSTKQHKPSPPRSDEPHRRRELSLLPFRLHHSPTLSKGSSNGNNAMSPAYHAFLLREFGNRKFGDFNISKILGVEYVSCERLCVLSQ
jgi:hypothetical protein